MHLFQRIVFAAVLAGLAAGLGMSALQHWKVTPLILIAETFESPAPASHAHAAETPDPSHDEAAWAPADGVERTAYTVLANVLTAIGFALLLAAASVLTGLPVTARNGIVWGVGGFVAFQLAPAVGLPPELPGMVAAELGARQAWWWATALSTGAGLLVAAKRRSPAGLAVAALLLLAPHLAGAPQPDAWHMGAVPAELASAYAAAALATGAAFWLALGPLLGWFGERFAKAETTSLKGAPA